MQLPLTVVRAGLIDPVGWDSDNGGFPERRFFVSDGAVKEKTKRKNQTKGHQSIPD